MERRVERREEMWLTGLCTASCVHTTEAEGGWRRERGRGGLKGWKEE